MSLFKASENEPFKGPHQDQNVASHGTPVEEAAAAMIMVHGRGASAESIIGLSQEISHEQIHYTAPQASGSTWYPYSFLQPTDQNEPGLSSGLQAIHDIVVHLNKKGLPNNKIFILGFSQGACLATEYVCRHPDTYAGLFALSGGLIGDTVDEDQYSGNLGETPVFMGCSDIDPHIPKERVNESAAVLKKLNAVVTKKLYPNMGHLVNHDEIDHIQEIIQSSLA